MIDADMSWLASLKVGDVVAVRRHRSAYAARHVEKITPKQVKLSDNVTFRISDGREIGGSTDPWSGRLYIYQMTDDILASIALDNARAKAERLLSSVELLKMPLQKLRELIAIAEKP